MFKKLGIATKLVNKPPYDTSFITHPLFKHPSFKPDQLTKIAVEHRPPITVGDKIANGSIKLFRSCFDIATGYKHPNKHGYSEPGAMTENKWLTRCIFLESVAGIPGMTAAFLRHLHSLRLLKRDKAWIETLLDEAYNERMHLLTFINLGKPSWFTRIFIYLGQGVFCNLFFFNYLFFPKFCHRFVGYLEEEAVSTYTHFINDLDHGLQPKFNQMKVPDVAVKYYDNLTPESSIKDLILNIRADEAKHREVNHTLANLHQKTDRNPFALTLEENQPRNDLKFHRGIGWDRKDIIMDEKLVNQLSKDEKQTENHDNIKV